MQRKSKTEPYSSTSKLEADARASSYLVKQVSGLPGWQGVLVCFSIRLIDFVELPSGKEKEQSTRCQPNTQFRTRYELSL